MDWYTKMLFEKYRPRDSIVDIKELDLSNIEESVYPRRIVIKVTKSVPQYYPTLKRILNNSFRKVIFGDYLLEAFTIEELRKIYYKLHPIDLIKVISMDTPIDDIANYESDILDNLDDYICEPATFSDTIIDNIPEEVFPKLLKYKIFVFNKKYIEFLYKNFDELVQKKIDSDVLGLLVEYLTKKEDLFKVVENDNPYVTSPKLNSIRLLSDNYERYKDTFSLIDIDILDDTELLKLFKKKDWVVHMIAFSANINQVDRIIKLNPPRLGEFIKRLYRSSYRIFVDYFSRNNRYKVILNSRLSKYSKYQLLGQLKNVPKTIIDSLREVGI